MAGTLYTDLAAVTINAADLAGTAKPLGFDIGQELDSLKVATKEIHRRATLLKSYCTYAGTRTLLDAVIADCG